MSKWRRSSPTRAELIELKHQLEGEIKMASAELRRLEQRGSSPAELRLRLASLQHRHHQTRLRIDRTPTED